MWTPLLSFIRRLGLALLLVSMAGPLCAQDGMDAFKEVLASDNLVGLEQLIAQYKRSGEPYPVDPIGGATVLHKAIHLGAGEPALAGGRRRR